MNLSQLYYFRKLAEVKHYTHAAEELFISQPTLSNSISQLERELGIPLFEREGRKIKLTKYGEEFYQYATEAVLFSVCIKAKGNISFCLLILLPELILLSMCRV